MGSCGIYSISHEWPLYLLLMTHRYPTKYFRFFRRKCEHKQERGTIECFCHRKFNCFYSLSSGFFSAVFFFFFFCWNVYPTMNQLLRQNILNYIVSRNRRFFFHHEYNMHTLNRIVPFTDTHSIWQRQLQLFLFHFPEKVFFLLLGFFPLANKVLFWLFQTRCFCSKGCNNMTVIVLFPGFFLPGCISSNDHFFFNAHMLTGTILSGEFSQLIFRLSTKHLF